MLALIGGKLQYQVAALATENVNPRQLGPSGGGFEDQVGGKALSGWLPNSRGNVGDDSIARAIRLASRVLAAHMHLQLRQPLLQRRDARFADAGAFEIEFL